MRRKFKDGTGSKTSILKTVMPAGTIVSAGKFIKNKIKKNKEAKESRNPNPKTPKKMVSDKPKKKTFKNPIEKERKEYRKFKLDTEKFRKFKKPDYKKLKKPLGKLKPEVRPSRRS